MLEKFREGSQGPGAKIILGAVIVSFALAGISSYLGGNGTQAVASIDGVDISAQALEVQVRNDRARLEQQQGEAFAARWEEPAFQNQIRQQALNTLISQNLLRKMADDLDLRVGDEQVREYIFAMDEFKTDGKFNEERYISLLRQNGMSPAQFVDRLRNDFSQQQLTSALINSEFSLPSEVQQLAELQGQQRELSVLSIPAAKFSQDIEVTDEEVATYYDERQTSFQTQAQAAVDYIVLDMQKISAGIKLEQDAALNFYNEHITDYQQADKRKVAHILVAFNDDESAAEAKAEGLLKELQAGADFAKVAKTSSDDTFSGEQGGELDWLEKGIMDPAFEAAAFELANIGDLTTTVVKSDFGFHLIKLLALEPGTVKSFADVEANITERLQSELAVTRFDELAETLAEQAFEVPDSLDVAATETGLELVSSPLFTQASAPAPLNNNAVLNLIFDTDFIDENLNSEIINISDDMSIVVRLNDFKPQTIKPLETVSAEIKQRLIANKAERKAQQFMQTLMTKVNAGESISADLSAMNSEFSAPQWVGRYDYTKADFKVLSKLFTMPKPVEGKASLATEVELNGDVTLLQFTNVKAQPLNAEEQAGLAASVKNMQTQSAYNVLVQTLIKAADVQYPAVAE